jgi:hypothetical protein
MGELRLIGRRRERTLFRKLRLLFTRASMQKPVHESRRRIAMTTHSGLILR